MIKKMAIDLDGVLADFIPAMVDALRKIGADMHPTYQPQSWHWNEANLPRNAMDKAWDIIDANAHFWETLAPLPDVVPMADYFQRHAGVDRDIYFITARKDSVNSAKHQSENWLYEYLGNPKQNITVLTVDHSSSKLDIVQALNIGYIIDDFFPTIAAISTKLKKVGAYLLTKSWNAKEHQDKIKRVYSLREFLDIVDNG